MHFFNQPVKSVLDNFSVNEKRGLSYEMVKQNTAKFGQNLLTQKKKKGFFARVLDAVKEPMLIILLFGFCIALGANIGKQLKTGDGDFGECFGILFAVILSVSITLIMEGSSQKAFATLNKIYDNLTVKVLRDGVVIVLSRALVTVGDIILLESGDKIVADGRLIESSSLLVDESALTGESVAVQKNAEVVLNLSTPLAERINCVYSGTFVTGGSGKMIVTAVGDKTEIGSIAGELSSHSESNSPLNQKLARLGKIITILGAVTAIFVFILSVVRLAVSGGITFDSVQDLFISCIVLIVAAVPEGMPTIVAVSLALNMIKLAGENALIKKMTATEACGAVSVICSDKTGTLTQNKMTVTSVFYGGKILPPNKVNDIALMQNFACNTTAELTLLNKKRVPIGSGTECALITLFNQNGKGLEYTDYRKKYTVINRIPFSSKEKVMFTEIALDDKIEIGKTPQSRILLKGAGERVLSYCNLTGAQRKKIVLEMEKFQSQGGRVICFAHLDRSSTLNTPIATPPSELNGYVFDGFAVLSDPVRQDVYKAVKDCYRAGIKVKMLTGDNIVTAYSIAKQLNIATNKRQVVNALDLDKLDDTALKKALPQITVIARSTPATKMRIVRILKSMGEVVAVTGDGINDAPAIKHADVGIAMGQSGSEITKDAADVVLLDDSFSTVVKAISFGRNVYRNLQRFILFQLSVNLSALLFITACAIMGLKTPFNTFQLLWINVIMDGPPALTLGLEKATDNLMKLKPIKRTASIVSVKMLFRIIFNGLFIGTILTLQYLFNFMNVPLNEAASATFTLFILFQLFNAFNSRELGAESIFRRIHKNKIMLLTFAGVFILHVVIVQFLPKIFGVSPMGISSWLKCAGVSISILAVSEIYKLVYRLVKNAKNRAR